MNSNGLVKHYDALTAQERFALIMAASSRGDTVEHARLTKTAPRLLWQISHHFPIADAAQRLAWLHTLEMLDLIAGYWRTTWMLEAILTGQPSQSENETIERISKLLKLLAFRFCAKRDGWQAFCKSLGIESDFLLNPLPGFHKLKEAEKEIRGNCPAETEAETLRGCFKDPKLSEVTTLSPESVAKCFREALDELVRLWA